MWPSFVTTYGLDKKFSSWSSHILSCLTTVLTINQDKEGPSVIGNHKWLVCGVVIPIHLTCKTWTVCFPSLLLQFNKFNWPLMANHRVHYTCWCVLEQRKGLRNHDKYFYGLAAVRGGGRKGYTCNGEHGINCYKLCTPITIMFITLQPPPHARPHITSYLIIMVGKYIKINKRHLHTQRNIYGDSWQELSL